jgi:YVTN family beta-propeller protein
MKNPLLLALALTMSAPAFAAHVPAPEYAIAAHAALGGEGGWDYLSLDATSHRLFIARDDRVMVMDTRSGRLVGQIGGMQHAHGVALVPSRHRGYVSNGHGDNVSVIDTHTLQVVGQIAVSGKDPDAIIVDPASGHVLAMNGHSNSISVIDPVAAKEIATIALPGNPEFAVTDGKGHLWVNLEDAGKLARIDLVSGTITHVWPLAPCEGPTGLALDAVGHRLFSVCANGVLAVTDADDGHQVAQLAIGKRPDAVAFDAEKHNVLSSSGEGTLDVIYQNDVDHYTVVQKLATLKSARTLALDPHTHRVFLAGAKVAVKGEPVRGFTVITVVAH